MEEKGEICYECGETTGGAKLCDPCHEAKQRRKRERYEYAMQRLQDAGFSPVLFNEENYHIKVGEWSFWAWTGKFYHPELPPFAEEERGLNKFISQLKKTKT